MFDGELGIALQAMQGNRASSRGEGDVSWFFPSCGGDVGCILKLRRGWRFKTCVCSATSRILFCYKGHLRNLHEAWQSKTNTSQGEAVDLGSLSSCHSDIGIHNNFQQESGIITF